MSAQRWAAEHSAGGAPLGVVLYDHDDDVFTVKTGDNEWTTYETTKHARVRPLNDDDIDRDRGDQIVGLLETEQGTHEELLSHVRSAIQDAAYTDNPTRHIPDETYTELATAAIEAVHTGNGMLGTKHPEPKCPECGHTVPIVHSDRNPVERWARHTQTGNLTSGDSPECVHGGQPWTGPTCPHCGRAGEYGYNTTTGNFDRCPRCYWPGK